MQLATDGYADEAKGRLQRQFGFTAFRPGQEEVIGHLLAGRSAAAVFPTGSGKSLCYQLPALMWNGLTLVVSPLIALMKDQIDALHERQIAAERIDSTLSGQEVASVMQRARSGELRLLYVAPERFNNERFREAIQRIPVALFAVDEAHCISEWGHNFRPDYLKLANFARRYRAERVLALTATATPQVLEDICRGFAIDRKCAVRTGFYRPNLTILTTPVTAKGRDQWLIDGLRSRPAGAAIIYVTQQRTAEMLAKRLQAEKFPARAYHAGMEDEQRNLVQDWFLAESSGIVVATIAFGMGIDKSDIRYVYHYNLPKSLENFSQEIGRSGRDGLPSICETAVCSEDLNVLENFIYGDTPSEPAVLGLMQEVLTQGDEVDVSLYDLANRNDIRQLVVRTLLVYLELDGYLEEGTPYYARYQFRPLVTSAEILERFEGDRQEFLRQVFRQARKSRVWFEVDIEEVATKTNSARERVVRALDYLSEQKLLELKVDGVRNRFRRLKQPSDVGALARQIYERLLHREQREIQRLAKVMDLITHDGCQVSHLGEYFGEPLPRPCGHCSWCLTGRVSPDSVARAAPPISESVWQQAQALRSSNTDVLTDPRAFSRFLCGITSPKLSRRRLSSNRLFGALGDVPFATVLERAT